METKTANTSQPLHQLIAERWSPRAFDPNRAISDEDIIALFEAARWAPSCYNEQPWRYIVCNKFNDTASWEKARDCLVPQNQLWAKNAPVLVLICSSNNFAYNNKDNTWSQYDTGQATAGLTVQATSMGIFAHQMAGFDPDKAKTSFGIPDLATPIAMMALGYQGNIEDLATDFVEGEQATRTRKPLGETAFNGSWDNPMI